MDMEFLIPIAFFIIVAVIVKFIIDHKTRRLLIEKGIVDEKVKYLFRNGIQPFSSMKWGICPIASRRSCSECLRQKSSNEWAEKKPLKQMPGLFLQPTPILK